MKSKRKPDPTKFWLAVQNQFESRNFDVIMSVRSAMECDHALGKALIPFLMDHVGITSSLDVLTRFDILPDHVKTNFIYLLCYTQHLCDPVPPDLLANEFHRMVFESFTAEPKQVVIVPKTSQKIEEEPQPEDDAVFEGDPTSPTFYDDLDNFVAVHTSLAEVTLTEHFQVTPFQAFYTSITEFFSKHRSPEGCVSVCRFVIRPYLASLKSSANRLVSDALMFLVKSIPEIFIEEVVQPIVFDPVSEVYQFELLQRMFNSPIMCQVVLGNIFKNRTPSLEAPLKKEALNYICTAIQKSPQLDDEIVMHTMLHLRTQIDHNPNDAARLFVFFTKNQVLATDELVEVARSIIELLPTKMKSFAIQSLEKRRQ